MKEETIETKLDNIKDLLTDKYTMIIERANDGVCVTINNSYQYNSQKPMVFVYNFGDGDNFKVEQFREFIWNVINEFDPTDKYSIKRVGAYVLHGAGYDCEKKSCAICKADTAVFEQERAENDKS